MNPTTPPKSKPCSHCGDVKPLDEFDFDKSRRDGRRPQCKPCSRNIGRISKLRVSIRTMEDKIKAYKAEIRFLKANPGVFLDRETRDRRAVETAGGAA